MHNCHCHCCKLTLYVTTKGFQQLKLPYTVHYMSTYNKCNFMHVLVCKSWNMGMGKKIADMSNPACTGYAEARLSEFHLTVWNGKTKMRHLRHFSRWTWVSWLSLSFFIHQFWKRTFGIKWRRLFLQAGCPFRYPTNSVKALKETSHKVLTPHTKYLHQRMAWTHPFLIYNWTPHWRAMFPLCRLSDASTLLNDTNFLRHV